MFGAKSGDYVFYRDYVDKAGLLTANATSPYALSFINLEKTGPIGDRHAPCRCAWRDPFHVTDRNRADDRAWDESTEGRQRSRV